MLLLDRLTKWLIETRMSFLDTQPVIPGFFDIVRSENRGVAFGLFNDSTSRVATRCCWCCFRSAAVIGVSVLLWRPERLDRMSRWGFALILGGAAGNVVDRMLYGRVTDFLLVLYSRLPVAGIQRGGFRHRRSAACCWRWGCSGRKPQAANVP